MAKFLELQPDRPVARNAQYWELADVEWLRDAHVTHKMGTKRIATYLGCCPKAVRMALRRHGVERPLVAATIADVRLADADWVRLRYEHDRRSDDEIGVELGCDRSTVHRWRKIHGITGRSRAGANERRPART